MGNETKVTTVSLAGAIATVLLWLVEPQIVRWRGEPIPAAIALACGLIVTAIVAYLLPPSILRRIDRRTRTKPIELPEKPQ